MDEFDAEMLTADEEETDSGEEGLEIDTKPDTTEEYRVLDGEETYNQMLQAIQQVADVVELEPTTCRLLLHHYKWDSAKLLEDFYAARDPSSFFKKANLVYPARKKTAPKRSASSETCQICVLKCRASSLCGLECGHRFCAECWNGYLSSKIIDEGQAVIIRCPQHPCSVTLDDKKAMDLIKSGRTKDRFKHLITDSFVEHNPRLCWCPKPDCGHAIQVLQREMREVVCNCNTRFCFSCGCDWHEPLNCALLKAWLKKCRDDSETSHYLITNTKECPNCQVSIEKNGGCNHMTCRRCQKSFCWLCLKTACSYNCNSFQEPTSVSESRASLQRYLFYSSRYESHRQSLLFENKLHEIVLGWQKIMQDKQEMGWAEVQFMTDAVKALCKCRQTLMYTYAFAFYLNKNSQQEIFEDNQRDLESATEQLSGMLERDVNALNARELKPKMEDKRRYVQSRRVQLLEHVVEGAEKEWFTFRKP